MRTRLVAVPVLALVLALLGCEQLAHTREDGSASGTTGVATSGHGGASSGSATSQGSSSASGSSSSASSGSSSGSTSTTTAGTTATTSSSSGSTTGTSSTGTTGTVPGAPTGVTVQIDGQPSSTSWTARLTWQPPASAGSSPILFYTVSAVAPANPGGTAPPPSSASYTVPATSAAGFGPLVDDAHYAFTVTATNAVGTSPPSAPVELDACIALSPPSFALAQRSSTPAPVRQVLLRDLNGDGLADMVGAAGSRVIWSLAGAPGGGLAPVSSYLPTTSPLTAVAVGDLNGDSKPDVVVLSGTDVTLYTLLGNGQGDFANGPVISLSPLASLAFSPAYVNVAIRPGANVGAPAIEVADTGNNQILDVENAVPGPATATANPINQASGGVLTGLVATPLSRGGKFDAVAVDDAANIDVWLAQGTQLSPVVSSTGPGLAQGVAAADLDGDGLTDLVIGENAARQHLSVIMGTPGGFAPQWRSYSLQGMSDANQTLAVADVNADGIPDIINANTSAGSVGVLLGVGDGGFRLEVTVLSGLASPSALSAGDFSGDGRADLAIGFSSTSELQLFVNTYACH